MNEGVMRNGSMIPRLDPSAYQDPVPSQLRGLDDEDPLIRVEVTERLPVDPTPASSDILGWLLLAGAIALALSDSQEVRK